MRGPWLLLAGGVALLALVLATELYVWLNLWPMRVSWTEALLWSLPQLYCWILLLPVAFLIARRWPVEAGHRVARIVLHAGSSVAFSIAALVLVDLSDRVIHWTRLLGAPTKLVADLRYTVIHLHFGMAVYWVTLGATHAVRFYREAERRAARAAELETELTRSQLDALRAQLRPHFLFNTLNSIAVLVRSDPVAAEAVVQRLGRLLRASLESRAQEVALEEEVALAREYLAIEQVRFRDRLDLEFAIDEETRRAAVPHLLLQPLVENAVRHAVAPRPEAGRISLAARRVGSDLEIVVADDGPGLRFPVGTSGTGIGLANTRRRLESLYGERQRLELRQAPGGGLKVRVVLPFRPVSGEAT
ncbi:MAG: sensor histidine kinase [Gemmatimonadales bacterium]